MFSTTKVMTLLLTSLLIFLAIELTVMRRDPTEFRKRFLAYKEGKMPYENGLPKYEDGIPAYQRFVEEMGPILYKEAISLGVANPDAAYRNMLTLLAYESNYGTSSVARKLNNYGGVGWNGKTYTTYKNKEDFAKNYVRLMNSRYKNVIGADTLSDYAKGLKKLGYYEDTLENYSRNLTNMKSFARAMDNHFANNKSLYLHTPVQTPVIQHVEPAMSTTVRQTIPQTQARARWTGAENISPYVTGKPMVKLNPIIKLPTLELIMDDVEWEPEYNFPGHKNGKLPGFEDGKEGRSGNIDLDENEKYMIEHSSLSTIDKMLTSLSSHIMGIARYYGTGVKSTEDAVKLRRELGGGTAQRTFLLPRNILNRVFKDDGYIEGATGDYGLVKTAVGDRNLPVYLTSRDAISRENLTHLYNILDGGYDTMYIDPNRQLVHAGSFPSAIYVDGSTGELYLKAWDLNDYGKNKGGTTYDGVLLIGAEFLNKAGNPVVVTTGYLPMIDEYGHRRNIADKLNLNLYREKLLYDVINKGLSEKGLHLEELNGKLVPMLPGIDVIFNKNTGKLSTYANGKSPIHIKPANRGKLTRLKARTGKSESELYNDGNPAHKKMVVFARNARKWKH